MCLLFLNWCRECFAACVVFLFFFLTMTFSSPSAATSYLGVASLQPFRCRAPRQARGILHIIRIRNSNYSLALVCLLPPPTTRSFNCANKWKKQKGEQKSDSHYSREVTNTPSLAPSRSIASCSFSQPPFFVFIVLQCSMISVHTNVVTGCWIVYIHKSHERVTKE
jgi:hypothetical protein